MSSLFGDREVHRSGTGVLTVGKEIGLDQGSVDDYGFSMNPKSTKVMLFNPPVSFDLFYGEWDMSDVKSSSPPIGILCLASMLRKYGYPVIVVDAHAENLSADQIKNLIAKEKPDVVGITAMTVMISAAATIAQMAKEVDDSITTILGGVHVTAEPTKTLQMYPQFDFACVGEGEIPLIDLLEKLDGDNWWDVQSIVWRDAKKEPHVNPRRSFFKSLDEFPPPAFDLVPNLFNHYRLSVFGTKKFRSVGLVTSRGCTGHCTFCDLGVVGRGYRSNSAAYLISLMKDCWKNYGVTDFLFYDDLFVGSRPRLKEICETIIKEKLPFTWSACARVDFMHTDMLKLMKEANCWMIEYGIESGCQRIIDSMRKNISKEKIRDTINKTHEAGIVTKGNFIFFSPGETHDSIMESIDFASSLKLDYAQHTFLQPLPGSELYETAHLYGDFDNSWDRFNTFSINFIPYGFTRQDGITYSKLFWRRFYLRPRIIIQELKKLRGKEDFKRLWLAIKGFIKTIFYKRKLPDFVLRQSSEVSLQH